MNKFLGVNGREGSQPFQSTLFNTQFNRGACLFEEDRHWGPSAGGSPLVTDSKGQDPVSFISKALRKEEWLTNALDRPTRILVSFV